MTTIKLRRGTASEWTASNPVLAEGEPGFEKDTGKYKLGDGVTAWNSLGYFVNEAVQRATYAGLNTKGLQALETQRASALRPFHAGLADRANAACDIVVIGDSITEGAQASARSKRWVSRLLDNLRTRFPVAGVIGGPGYFPTYYAGGASGITLPAPATLTGSPVQNVTFGLGKRSSELTTGKSAQWTVTGTSVDVLFAQGTSSGIMGVSIDGGAVTNINTSTTVANKDLGIQRVSLGASGSHTVTLSWVSGGTVYPEGIMVYDGDENSGVRLWESGHWGWQSGDWSNSAGSKLLYLGQRLSTINPKLVVIELGTNDYGNAGTAAAMRTNLEAIIAQIKASVTNDPSFVLLGLYKRSGTFTNQWSDFQAQFEAMEEADPQIAYFDFSKRLPTYSTNSELALVNADGVHPTDKGHGYLADALAGFLSPR